MLLSNPLRSAIRDVLDNPLNRKESKDPILWFGNSLRLLLGYGPATFARPSEKTVEDHEGLLKTCLDDEIAIEGARRVENLAVESEVFDTTWWQHSNVTSATDQGNGEWVIVFDGTVDARVFKNNTAGLVAGDDAVFSVELKGVIGETITIEGDTTAAVITLTDSYVRYSVSITGLSGAHFRVINRTGNTALNFNIRKAQIERTTGQTIQEPGEYVSKGVESAPYHGFGVDGVKSFLHENGNTVSSNIVVEARGSDISGTIGKHLEGASTNSALYCRDFTQAEWVATNITPLLDAVGIDGATAASTLTADAGNGTIFQTVTIASSAHTTSFDVRRKTGTGTIEMTDDGGSNYTDITSLINSSTYTRLEIKRTQANPDIGFRIVTSGDEIEVDYAQNEDYPFATSRIYTTSGTATREADDLSIQVEGNFIDAQGSLYVDFTPDMDGADLTVDSYLCSTNNSGDGRLLYISQSTDKFRNHDGTSAATDSGAAVTKGTAYKLATTWGNGTKRIAVNGASASSAYDGSWSPSTIIQIGAETTPDKHVNGIYGTLLLYPTQHPQAIVEAKTS